MLAGRLSVMSSFCQMEERSAGSTTAQSDMKSDGRFQRPSESFLSKKQEPQRKSGNCKEVSWRIHSVKANGTGVTSV